MKTITPPPELYAQWRKEAPNYRDCGGGREEWLMDRAAQWGWDQRGTINEAQLQERADQELEACCEWLRGEYDWGLAAALRLDAERRPEPPPTLKEQALAAVAELAGFKGVDTIRRALEALPND